MEQLNKLFIEFLKDNNALKQYVKNVRNFKKSHFLTWEHYTNPFTIEPLEQCLNDSRWTDNLITCSFLWQRTPEGHDFWKNLNNKWKKQLK